MKNRKSLTLIAALATVACVLAGLGAVQLDPARRKGLETIKWSTVYDYNRTLASDRFGGRYSADASFTEAAKWVSAKFKSWGLKPLNAKDGYLQTYPLPYTLVDKAEMTLFIPEKKAQPKGPGNRPPDGPPMFEPKPEPPAPLKEKKLEPITDFLPLLSTGKGEAVQAGIVFAGYGISLPEAGYDDYAGLDVKGKFVLYFSGTPEIGDKFDEARKNVPLTARDKGALGILRISDPIATPSGTWAEGSMGSMISESVVDLMLDEKGLTVEKLKGDLRLYKRPLSFALNSKISCKIDARRFPDGKACNIVGTIEGSDPKLKDEVVLYGAHADHMGRQFGYLFPGADDNASGSAVVMQIAEAFAKMGRRPKRTVAFALFSGEEFGLIGSQYMAKNLPPQFKKIAVMINFDMVGEGDAAAAGCSPEPPELKASIEQAGAALGGLKSPIRLNQPTRLGGTDHTSFAVILKCPTAGFFSNGPHISYHKPGDTIYRINPDILADIARVAYLSGDLFADR